MISMSSRRARRSSAAQMWSNPAPKFSRRWPVTSSSRRGKRHRRQSLGEPGAQRRAAVDPRHRRLQRVDDRVAGDDDAAVEALRLEVRPRARGGREQEVADHVDRAPVHFFRPRLRNVVGAQPCLDVAHRHAPVKRRQRRHHRRRRVAMDQHLIGAEAGERRVELFEQPRRQPVEGLVGGHHVEITVGPDAEQLQHLAQHR
jgi:hypothetical protein